MIKKIFLESIKIDDETQKINNRGSGLFKKCIFPIVGHSFRIHRVYRGVAWRRGARLEKTNVELHSALQHAERLEERST